MTVSTGASIFAHLLDAIAPEDGAVVVLHHVYLDESGTHDDSPAISVGGYVFEKDQAQLFSREWEKELARFGIPFAHMTDCATGNGHYAKLSMNERIEPGKALISLIRRRSLFGIAATIDYKAYRKLFGRGRFDYDAYSLCIGVCVKLIDRWAMRSGFPGQFAYVLEAGHDAQSEANQIMNDLRKWPERVSYFSHTFVDKKDAPPLQAADMLAWQCAHHVKRRGEGHDKVRNDFAALLRPCDELLEY